MLSDFIEHGVTIFGGIDGGNGRIDIRVGGIKQQLLTDLVSTCSS